MAERDEAVAARAAHPDWQVCPVCTWPIHPAALEGGFDTHPSCGPYDEPTATREATTDAH